MSDPVGPGVVIGERRLHPVYLLISAGRTIRGLLPVIAVTIWRAPWWLLGGLGLLVAGGAVAGWWARRYQVADGVLQVRSGVIRRSIRTVPISRITASDAHRGVIQRLLGVWALRIQTPGDGNHSTVHLSCLSAARLDELRSAVQYPAAQVVDPGQSAVADPVTVSDPVAAGAGSSASGPVPLAVLDTRTLLITAVTGASVPLIIAGGGAAWNRLQEILPVPARRWLQQEIFGHGRTTLVLVLAGLVIAVAVGIALTALRLARFTLVRDGDRLVTTRGLIAQRTGTIAVGRVQAVRIVEGVWRRRIGWCALDVEVAGVGRSFERTLFPLVRTSQVDDLIHRAVPELGRRSAELIPPPARARRRYLTLPILVGAAAAVATLLLPGWWALLAVVPITAAIGIGRGQAVDAGWSADRDLTVLRWRRILARHTVIARTPRVQLTRATRTPFQRRADLAGIRLSLSSGRGARVRHLEADDVDRMLHLVGRRAGLVTAAVSPPIGVT